ncbi:MAG: prepilin-type N-terminal cleavage/methylation domain-containing protein [Elusimicrobiota bacterium]|nr:prepilin-type N-terminal cleavage/methylation domain-containing protein [Elusimicrobiota bacterium]
MKRQRVKTGGKGFTLVEMMITMAILAIIFIPLVKIMMSATKTWWFARAKMTIEQDGRDALSFMNKEFQGAYRFSMGNLLYNAGFEGYELDMYDRPQPSLWPSADYGDVFYNRSASTAIVASGYASVTLAEANVLYDYTGPAGEGFEILASSGGPTEVMFSFKAKASTGAVFATDITGSVKLSGAVKLSTGSAVGISSTTWQEFVIVGDLEPAANYNVVFKTTNGGVIIDEVAVRPVSSLLYDFAMTPNVTSYIYVSQTSGGAPGEAESMFKIGERQTQSGHSIKRLNCYSVDYVASDSDWSVKARFYNALAENLRYLEFKLDSADLVADGTDAPITIILQMGARVKGRKYGDPTTFTIRKTIYPRK